MSGRSRIHSPASAVLCVSSVLSVLIVLLATSLQAQSKTLARRLDAILDAPGFNHQLWGIALVDKGGKLLYGRNADRLFIPASNTKLVVTSNAVARLSPDFKVKTSLYATGPLSAGVLAGDLVLYGRGDPTWSRRCYGLDTTVAGSCDTDEFAKFRQLATDLRTAGVREVLGDLVGDGSYFEPQLISGEWSAYDLNWWYAAPVSGLGFNDNSVDLHWKPAASEGQPAELVMDPDLGDLTLENRSRTIAVGGRTTLDFFRTAGTLGLWAEGDVALDNRGGTESFALPDPAIFAARAFRQVLGQAGITIRGTVRSTTDSLQYRAARGTPPLAEVESRPLKEWIFPILNTSQNWFAEMLLKQLGRQFGTAGSWQSGIAVERRFLIDSMAVDSAQISLADGSGLSADNLVSPLAFTRVLNYMRRNPNFAVFTNGLPRAGQPGSLRNRFKGTPLEGRVAAKTGTISLASSLSGYIFTAAGDTLVFSIQANHHTATDHDMKAEIDSLVVAMAHQPR
ncbi:MAG: D-alanyl-D-alanine carboxypeptidase/D-alanyl-D-alanine-endopeptidase [Gemmatimonadota bacterium]